MSDELKPCIFCGSDEVVFDWALGKRQVICLSCEASGPTEETDEEAAAAWNRRASTDAARPAQQPVIDMLEGYAENYDAMARQNPNDPFVSCLDVAQDIRANMIGWIRRAAPDAAKGEAKHDNGQIDWIECEEALEELLRDEGVDSGLVGEIDKRAIIQTVFSILVTPEVPTSEIGEKPAAIVRDNPDDIGTIIEAQRPLPVGSKLYLAAPEVTADDGRGVVSDLFKSRLTPYGLLVRALRVVTKTTLGDMAKAVNVGTAELSAIEHGRKPLTGLLVLDTAEYFGRLGFMGLLPILDAALAAQNGEKA